MLKAQGGTNIIEKVDNLKRPAEAQAEAGFPIGWVFHPSPLLDFPIGIGV